jgi:hypothetical protein
VDAPNLVRHVDVVPDGRCATQRGERRSRVAGGQTDASRGPRRDGVDERSLERTGNRCDLVGRSARRGQVAGRQQHIDVCVEQAKPGPRLARLANHATERRPRRIEAALRQPQQRESGLRRAAGCAGETIGLLGLGYPAMESMNLRDQVVRRSRTHAGQCELLACTARVLKRVGQLARGAI